MTDHVQMKRDARRGQAGLMLPLLLSCLGCAASAADVPRPITAAPAAAGAIRLIVMADDIGITHGVNAATFAAHKQGVVTTTNVIVPAAWFPEAVRLANETPGFDIGLHIALTSEWSGCKWRPLTHPRTLVDEDGYFFPMVWRNPSLPAGSSLAEANLDLAEVKAELRAQIELGKKRIPRVSYLWTHMAFVRFSKDLANVVHELAAEYDIPLFDDVISEMNLQQVDAGYDKSDSGARKAEKLTAFLDTVGPGTWLMVDHASDDSPEMRAISHPGYENVAADRAANLAMWTDARVKDVINRRHIQLVSAADVVKEWRAKRSKATQ